MGPRRPPNPGPGLHPGPRAPRRGQEPPDSPGAVGGVLERRGKGAPESRPAACGFTSSLQPAHHFQMRRPAQLLGRGSTASVS